MHATCWTDSSIVSMLSMRLHEKTNEIFHFSIFKFLFQL